MNTDQSISSPETAVGLMTTLVPTAHKTDRVSHVLERLARQKWDDINLIYIITADRKLSGLVRLETVLSTHQEKMMEGIVVKPLITVEPDTDQEKVVIDAIKLDVEQIPVVDKNGIFLGAIVANKIIDVLHTEHLEDFLRSSGIQGKGTHILELAKGRLFQTVKSRLPWLVVGLGIGLFLSFISSIFESSLAQNIALVYFIPVIAYVAAAVGVQTENIFIRAITVLKINLMLYLVKEFFVGLILGTLLGALGGIGAIIISKSLLIGYVVGLSLFAAITLSTLLACLVPIILRSFKKDPALGSGPLATAIQDLISITIYFTVASIILS